VTSVGSSPSLLAVVESIVHKPPFKWLTVEEQGLLFSEAALLLCPQGQRILRPDSLPDQVLLVLSGTVRLLAKTPRGSRTLDRRGTGQLLGWVSLLRASPCEWVLASEDTVLLGLPAETLVACLETNTSFYEAFAQLRSVHELDAVLQQAATAESLLVAGWQEQLQAISDSDQSWSASAEPGLPFTPPDGVPGQLVWLLSTEGVPGKAVGQVVQQGEVLPFRPGFQLPYRLIGVDLKGLIQQGNNMNVVDSDDEVRPFFESPGQSLEQLGILEQDHLALEERFPEVRGKGQLDEALAVCEMAAIQQQLPFRRDAISKVLEAQFRRNKALSVEMLAGLMELLGLNCQLAVIDTQHLSSVEAPALFLLEGVPVVLFSHTGGKVVLGHPHRGLLRESAETLRVALGESLKFASPRRISSTPRSRFGWNWFTPLLGKYKRSLILVFVASLLAQLFGLAIPLLIQQIIDKVLSQGNLSSLNVLGAVMVVLALFQGVLMALRTYIFVDTTDRMDLTLGTAVIDRLLALPLTYFEKRPVGELSQRLGELNTIRGFLTGTALVSVLNIIFALLYLLVMLVYSPFLTAIALSTLPMYVLLVFGVAPIYKSLIRKRAVASARTQSHLIEILGGIQTVKAQHFELTARWKWQDRYRHFVSEGFKSTALGATSGEIGKFLNTVSGLLVLWVGMGLVLQGELTLGMLIAFRIIAGNVTGPLLQLSGLYQGFQAVQLSMERLSDILDQNPELSSQDEIGQISMPPIEGSIRFEGVRFRFGNKGPYQIDSVDLAISPGSFVGIVGQSGSGKSTLTKLIPKLYQLNEGRIFIDDYDISKVNLSSLRRQIGIVPQDSLLFEGTVADNIALNDPQASTDAIIAAAKIACAHDFIMALGQGYATPLAERGGNLSGGQRQRIAIARTILSNPHLLVMDEATSALDYSTERQLCLNLQQWAEGRTVLFITHRLSSIRNSDLILVMHDGRLVEQGTHLELMQAGERYAVMYQQQGD
jgi:HlyB family type I secretion system ABC transporter